MIDLLLYVLVGLLLVAIVYLYLILQEVKSILKGMKYLHDTVLRISGVRPLP